MHVVGSLVDQLYTLLGVVQTPTGILGVLSMCRITYCTACQLKELLVYNVLIKHQLSNTSIILVGA